MKKVLPLIAILLVFASCGNAKKTARTTPEDRIVNHARTFSGTPYAWGGTTRKGMDCSGLIYVSYKEEGITLPRVSRDMATRGKKINKSAIKKGDLVFFKTSKRSKKINHVGLVTEVKSGTVYFIHSTTSKGVLTSSLEEKYWKKAYNQARRIL